MTLEQLKYLCAIVETGSFRAAAESLFRSQSSLSVGIQNLEKQLNIKLFNREQYRPELTKAGKAIYQKACRLRQQEQELCNLAEHLAKDYEAELRLSISGIVPIEPIIKVFSQLKEQFPDTKMILLTENLAGTLERLHDDDADIAITEVFEDEKGFESKTITEVTFISLVPAQSAWAERASSLTEQDMENETMIIVRDTSTHSQKMSKGFDETAPQWVVNDFSAKQRILCSGTGWGRMPQHLVQQDLDQGKLLPLNPQFFRPISVPIKMVRKTTPCPGPIAHQLWQSLQNINWKTEADLP